MFAFLAMASISEAGIGGAADITLIVSYIVIATALVWVPVGVVVFAGDRAAVILEHGRSWLTSHAEALRVGSRWGSVLRWSWMGSCACSHDRRIVSATHCFTRINSDDAHPGMRTNAVPAAVPRCGRAAR